MNEVAEEQTMDEVWREVYQLGRTRIDPEVFKMKDKVFMFTKSAYKN